ncbi:MAG: cell division protein FtsA [Candidatus Omnitrophica bacterium]|nr:cell division protein FtsA [Candidatus Omnitrophota bacterium]
MKKNLICGLDIGNSKLVAVLAKKEKQHLELLATVTSAVNGISKGAVKNLADLSDCIQQALDKLTKDTGSEIKNIFVSINGDYINARTTFATMALSERGSHQISISDINYLRKQARLLGMRIDETILHEFPQVFILDDTHSTVNPLGLLARKIKLDSYILNASHISLGNIKTAVQQAGYEAQDVIYSGVASSLSVLNEEERKKGIILIDMGACFTSLLFFKDNILRDFKMISFGGNDITDDISKTLELQWDLAEDIKKSSLILSAQESSGSEKLVVRRGNSYKTLEKKDVYEATKARIGDFMDKIKAAIDSSSWKAGIECGIVGAGGAANLEGILERIESHTGISARLGNIKNISSKGAILGPQFSAAVGLIYYGSNLNNPPNLKSYFAGKTKFERSVNFLCNLYQDYF